MAVARDDNADSDGRSYLSALRGLLVLSQLMIETDREPEILHLASTAVPALAPSMAMTGVLLADGAWAGPPVLEESVLAAVATLQGGSGQLDLGDSRWVHGYKLTALRGHAGYLVVGGDQAPEEPEQFLLRALAQQLGTALGNVRLHEQERAAAKELESLNARLEETVAALRRSMDIHNRLTDVAVSGQGPEGLAIAIHEVTGFPIAIEDRYGNLTAWAGPDRPDPYPKDPALRREGLIERIVRAGKPQRDGGRVVAVARPRPDLVGTIVLIDAGKQCGEQELVALEHGATVLAMELARIRSLADSELRVRRDLVEELLAGTDEDSAVRRSQALGYDLQRPHRVVIAEGSDAASDDEAFLHATSRAARELPVGTLMVRRGQQVIVLADHDADWEAFRRAILHQLNDGRCRIGVGQRCTAITELPRSHRQAEHAISLQAAAGWSDRATRFEDLGVFRLLATTEDQSEIGRFVDHWFGPLLRYDAQKGSDLVLTLTEYLEQGGNYDATAAGLCIHRSTLKYRLQRIRDITQLDLADPDTRFNLQLAARARQTLGAARVGTEP